MTTMITGWWYAADDGTVWPCEWQRSVAPGQVLVTTTLGPEKGKHQLVPRRRVYDGSFQHPTGASSEARA